MALVVEDGSGLSTAESYASVAFATTFLKSVGKGDAWDAIDDKEVALRLATMYMLQQYRALWQGTRTRSAQALDWPRYDVCVDGFDVLANIVPDDIKKACALLALKTAAGDLTADVSRATSSEKVGDIEVKYFEGQSTQTRYQQVEDMLAPYFESDGTGSYSIGVVRA